MGLCCCSEELALLAFGTTCCRCVNGEEAPCLTSACREVSSGGREWGNTLLDAKARGHCGLVSEMKLATCCKLGGALMARHRQLLAVDTRAEAVLPARQPCTA